MPGINGLFIEKRSIEIIRFVFKKITKFNDSQKHLNADHPNKREYSDEGWDQRFERVHFSWAWQPWILRKA